MRIFSYLCHKNILNSERKHLQSGAIYLILFLFIYLCSRYIAAQAANGRLVDKKTT